MGNLNPKKENPIIRELFIKLAEDVLAIMLKNNLTQELDQKAVVLTVWKRDKPTPYLKTIVGTTFPDDAARIECYYFSEEKLQRLFANPCHVSSWQSRNEKEDKWGGAIIADINGTFWGISVSGLEDWEDEAMSLILGGFGVINFEDPLVAKIIAASDNKEYVKSVADAYLSE